MQQTIKSLRRLDTCLYAVLVLLLITCVSLNVFVALSAQNPGTGLSWAQILYIVVLSATLVYGVVMEVVIHRVRKPYVKDMQQFVTDTFEAHEDTLKGGKNVEVSIYLVGEKLTVAKQGSEDLIYFDLAPVKKSSNVCGFVLSLVKKYLSAYYVNNLADGYYSVAVTDAVSKPKVKKVIENGAPVKPKARNPFLKAADGEKTETEEAE